MRETDSSELFNIALTASDYRLNRVAAHSLFLLIDAGYDEAVVEAVELRRFEKPLQVSDSETNGVAARAILALIRAGHGPEVIEAIELELIENLLFSDNSDTSVIAAQLLVELFEEGLGHTVSEVVNFDKLQELLFSSADPDRQVAVGNVLIALADNGHARAVANSIDPTQFRQPIVGNDYPLNEILGRLLESFLKSRDKLAVGRTIRIITDLSEEYPRSIPEVIDIGVLERFLFEESSETSVAAAQILATLAEHEISHEFFESIDLSIFDEVLARYGSERSLGNEQVIISVLQILRQLVSAGYADPVVSRINLDRFEDVLTDSNEEVRTLARHTLEALTDAGYGRAIGEAIEYPSDIARDAIHSESTQARPIAPGANFAGADLSRRKLSGAHLEYANLSEASLVEGDLSGADLSEVNLRHADLSGADLEEANLSGADLSGVNLSNASLRGAVLSHAILTEVNAEQADFSGANLRCANFSRADLSETVFKNADLTEVDFSAATLFQTDFTDSTLKDVEFSNAQVSGVEFDGVDEVELLESILNSYDELTQGVGVDAAAVLVDDRPSDGLELRESLISAFSRTDIPSVQATVIRSLATLGIETDLALRDYDEIFAKYLIEEDDYVRETAATNIAPLVIDNPHRFSETLAEYRNRLNDSNNHVRLAASKTLAVVAHDNPGVIDDLEELRSELTKLQKVPDLPKKEIERAIGIVEEAMAGAGEGALAG